MTRRKDTKTAELVEIALLTRAAFEQERGRRYAHIAGVPAEIIDQVFARSPGSFRSVAGSSCGTVSAERRKAFR